MRIVASSNRSGLLVILALVCFSGVSGPEAAGPHYSSPETRTVIERMIAAHGGMDRWRAAPTISFSRKAVFENNPQKPWVLHETIEQDRRRLYQSWPGEEILLADDGVEVWTVNWKPLFPPRFVARIGFYFLNMPWITQDPGVILEEIGRGTHPVSDGEYVKVALSFEPGTGDTPKDRYVLYIDPESHLLQAIEYHVSYGALLDASYLPPSTKTIGPFYHVNHEFESIDGLRVPVRYSVHGQSGSRTIAGEVSAWSFRKEFDEARLEKPPEAVVDTSSPRRRVE